MLNKTVYTLTSIQEFKNIINNNNSDDIIINVSSTYNYKIVRYNKHFLSSNLISTYGLFRSVILNKENKVISFAPPKSLHSDTFIEKYSNKTNNIIAEEFVEGFNSYS